MHNFTQLFASGKLKSIFYVHVAKVTFYHALKYIFYHIHVDSSFQNVKNFFHFNYTGRCICQHNTKGDFCERCVSGYYGNPKNGSEYDCKPCPCPDGGPCVQLHNGDVVCTDCKEGHGGKSYFLLWSYIYLLEHLQFFIGCWKYL